MPDVAGQRWLLIFHLFGLRDQWRVIKTDAEAPTLNHLSHANGSGAERAVSTTMLVALSDHKGHAYDGEYGIFLF